MHCQRAYSGDTQGTDTFGRAVSKIYITEEDREFWAFQPLKRPTPPTPKNAPPGASPIDRFILATLEQKNLTLNPEAPKATLLIPNLEENWFFSPGNAEP